MSYLQNFSTFLRSYKICLRLVLWFCLMRITLSSPIAFVALSCYKLPPGLTMFCLGFMRLPPPIPKTTSAETWCTAVEEPCLEALWSRRISRAPRASQRAKNGSIQQCTLKYNLIQSILLFLTSTPNYPPRHPKYHRIETTRPLIEVHWGV